MISSVVDSQIRSVIISLFPKYDKNDNGRLSAHELTGFLNDAMDLFGFKLTVSREQAEQTLRLFDKNWDGEMSKEELYTSLRYIINKESAGQHIFTPKQQVSSVPPVSQVKYPEIPSKVNAPILQSQVKRDQWDPANNLWPDLENQTQPTKSQNKQVDPLQKWTSVQNPWVDSPETISTSNKTHEQPLNVQDQTQTHPLQESIHYEIINAPAVVSDVATQGTNEVEEIIYQPIIQSSQRTQSLPELTPNDSVPSQIPVLPVQVQPLHTAPSHGMTTSITVVSIGQTISSEQVLKKLEQSDLQDTKANEILTSHTTQIKSTPIENTNSTEAGIDAIPEPPPVNTQVNPTEVETSQVVTNTFETNTVQNPIKESITIQTQTSNQQVPQKPAAPILSQHQLGPSWVKPVSLNLTEGWSRVQINTPQELKLKHFIDEMFNRHDKDGSGCLDIEELAVAFNDILDHMQVKSQLNSKEAIDLMNSVDKSQDHKIQRWELYECVKLLMKP